ncbi:MBL fold metallo-hydrolase [Georgenia yuyongxinii]
MLTHAHFDHLGVARQLRDRLQVPVSAPEQEHYLVAHPYRYAHENMRGVYPLRYPRAMPILGAMARAAALTVKGVSGVRPLDNGVALDVPGSPRVDLSPGHTFGDCALHLPERTCSSAATCWVTLDPYTAHTGPRIIAGAATTDSAMALRSLNLLAATGAGTVLAGHGESRRGGVRAVVDLARSAGPS